MGLEVKERKRYKEILQKVMCGIYKISEKRKGKSKLWYLYGKIQKEDGSYVKEVVYCHECRHIFKFNVKQTANLVRHKCYINRRHQLQAELAAKSGGQEKVINTKQLDLKEKQSIVEACLQWKADDSRPFSTSLGSEGFRKMMHTFLKLGAKHGENVDLENIFADSPKTISRCNSLTQDTTTTTIKQDLSEDNSNQTCMEFSQENENEMEFSTLSNEPLTPTFERSLSTPLMTSLDTSLDTSFNAQKRVLQPPKLVYLTNKVSRVEEPKKDDEEQSNIATVTVTTKDKSSSPPAPITTPKPIPAHEVGISADGCTIFADHIACKMRQYSIRTRNIAQHHINNILFDADMGKYEVTQSEA